MQRCSAALLLLLWSASTATALSGDHPIQKVIVQLEELSAKAVTEGKAEEVTYAKFAKWCQDSLNTLNAAIDESKDSIDTLTSKIGAKTKKEATLKEDITKLEKEILKYETSGSTADGDRKDANDLYTTADADFESTIAAIGDVITALEASKTTTATLMQVKDSLRVIAALPLVMAQASDEVLQALNEDPGYEEIMAKGDSKAHEKKYAFKSGNVIELCKSLKQKFEEDRVEATKAETNSANAYELAKQAREAALEAANTAKDGKTTLLGEVQGELAEAKLAKTDAEENLEADETSHKDTTQGCNTKKSEFDERTEIRQHELAAMKAACEILSKATGVRTDAPSNPVPPPSPLDSDFMQIPDFLQLAVDDPKARAVNLLRREARATHSKSLGRFAEEIAAKLSGPFDEVNGMIQKMIFQLMAEQKDEDDHKNWCDREISKTNSSKTNKEDKITSLNAKIDEAKAKVTLLGEEIVAANEMIEKLTSHIKEMTEIREAGKMENKLAIKDAEDAQSAIANAQAVLEAFYKESGAVKKEAWELLQRGDGVTLPDAPEAWGSSYTGVSDPAAQPGGIISVLEATAADFARMEADTKAQEAEDQKKFETERMDTDIEKSRRTKEAEMKTQEKKRTNDKVAQYAKSLKRTEDELFAVELYLKDLEPACVDGDSTYEDRKGARAQEIEALKQAQVILADAFKEKPEDAATSLLTQGRLRATKVHI